MSKYVFDLVLFDCDGTLVETESLLNRLMSDLMVEMGFEDFTYQRCHDLFSGHNYDYVKDWLKKHLPEFPIGEFEELYYERAAHAVQAGLSPIPGVTDVLDTLKDRNIGLVTNGHHHVINYTLEMTDLKKYFPDICMFTYEMVENPKPAPDLYKLACKTLGESPANAVAIEDSLVGIKAAAGAGVYTVGFINCPNPEKKHKDLAKQMMNDGANEVIYSFKDFQKIIDRTA